MGSAWRLVACFGLSRREGRETHGIRAWGPTANNDAAPCAVLAEVTGGPIYWVADSSRGSRRRRERSRGCGERLLRFGARFLAGP